MTIGTDNFKKSTDLGTLRSHTEIDKKSIGSVIMKIIVSIWNNFNNCTDLLNFCSHTQTETMKFECFFFNDQIIC